MKRPNFFIVGAPKCGTSTLTNELRWHPDIFVPLAFEPQYFCRDFEKFFDHRFSLERYLKLFANATDSHRAVGEKSVIYLYSDDAVKNILEFNPESRLIVMLRNPVDLVYSWHSQLYYTFIEHIPDFVTAWKLQESRQRGKNIGKYCNLPIALQYREIGSLGKYVSRLYDQVPHDQLKVLFMEDFHAEPDRIYRETLEFLDTPFAPRNDTRRLNSNKRHRSRLLGAALTHGSKSPLKKVVDRVSRLPGIRNYPVRPWLSEWNKVEHKRQPLNPDFRRKLVNEFRDDIALLSKITDRNLDHWLR